MDKDMHVIALPWFYEDDYEDFRDLLRERQWHRNYQDWKQAAPEARARLERQGMKVVQVPVRTADLKAFCDQRTRRVNNDALVDYCNEWARASRGLAAKQRGSLSLADEKPRADHR